MEWDDKRVKLLDLLIKGVMGLVITAAIAFFPSDRRTTGKNRRARATN
jgi:hypothetical protein